MSTLSWSIIGLVVLVLLIVIAHNVMQGRREQEERLSLRKGHFNLEDDEPDTLTAMGRSGGWHSRDDDRRGSGRRDPVMTGGRGQRREVPPSLAARPHRFDPLDEDEAPRGPRRGRSGDDDERAMFPSLRVDDEDFVETPFENPATVRPWSSREDAAARKAAQREHEEREIARQGRRRDPLSGQGEVVRDRGNERHHAAGFQGSLADPQARRERMHSMRAGEDAHEGRGGGRSGAADAGRRNPARDETRGGGGAQGGGYFSDDAPAPRAGRAGAERPMMPANPFEPPENPAPRPRSAATALPASLRARHAGEPDESWQIDEDRIYGDEDELSSSAAGAARARTHHDEAYGSTDRGEVLPAGDDIDAAEQTGAGPDGAQADDGLPEAPVEHVVVLEPPGPINTDRLVVLTSSLRHVGGKPVRIEVERLGGHWGPLTAGEKAVRMRCSLLLANRQGPLNAVELSDFNAAVESLASQIQAPVTIPDMAPILRNARELDTLAAKLDTQVEVRVELPEAAELATVTGLVRQLGLSDKGGGHYEAYADSGDMLFALTFNKARDRIDFLLDVPRTAEHHEAWEGMVACASSMAQGLRGRMVDSAGRGMSVGMIKTVEKQLAQRYAQLNQVGLRAGGPAAMRVFH